MASNKTISWGKFLKSCRINEAAGYEDLRFPLDWKTLDVSGWKRYVGDYVGQFGWKKFFTGPFGTVQYPELVLDMLEKGLSAKTTDEQFPEIFTAAFESSGVPRNTNLMKDFVGKMLLNLSGKDSGQVF